MEKRDYYEILGISREADPAAVKSAYRKLALKYHPDRNPGDKQAEDSFKEATEAYEVLSDADKRQRYDRYGHQGLRGGQDFGSYQNVSDIFSDLFGGGIFDDFFGGGRTRSGQARQPVGEPGSDLEIPLPLSLEEIALGIEKTIKYKRFKPCDTCSGSGAQSGSGYDTCPTCHGNGRIQNVRRSVFGQFVNVTTCTACNGSGHVIKDVCQTCKGEGRQQGETTVKVTVPAGVASQNYIPIAGKGHAGRRGGDAGDLFFEIREKEHQHFNRQGNNILYDLTISFPDAALGGEVEVPTLEGSAMLNIEAGTQPGTVLRMRDKGIPNLNSYGRGDQLIRVNVYVPTTLTSKEKGAIKDLAKSGNIAPSSDKVNKESRDFFDKVREVFS